MTDTSRSDELLYRIALLLHRGVGATLFRSLLAHFGSAEAVFQAPPSELLTFPKVGQALSESIRQPEPMLDRARRELDFMSEHHIRPLAFDDPTFPHRLVPCSDAPALLYALGPVPLDAPHAVAIVGTRRCTQYGRDQVQALVRDLRAQLPDTLIVSGLALGIDGAAHTAALEQGLPTVGVLAHGLDTIYPAAHRALAAEMVQRGGLLTEYPSHAHVDRGNFLARNRIIAGLADVTLVAESSTKGGALVTAHIASGYGREVCAFPGRATDDRSHGCNDLIRRQTASLVTSAADLMELMGWTSADKPQPSRQQELWFDEADMAPDQRRLIDYLRRQGDADVSELSDALGMDTGSLYELLLQLEVDNRIRTTKGNRYELR
jgi:DNA processing protein